jgi:hypothetical protein
MGLQRVSASRLYSRLLRGSRFIGPHVLVTNTTWHQVADLVWKGYTIPKACEELGLDWRYIERIMPETARNYFIDVAMVANAKEEYLGASNDTD